MSSPDRTGGALAAAAPALGVLPEEEEGLAAGWEAPEEVEGAAEEAWWEWCSLLFPLPVLISVDPLPASFFDLRRHI